MPSHQTRILNTQRIARSVVAVMCQKPDEFFFKAGQHVEFTIANPDHTDKGGDTRTLSITSAPTDDHLLFVTRIGESAFKRSFAQLKPGDAVAIDGPYGSLTLHRDSGMPAVLLAGGIGVSVARAIVRDAAVMEYGHDMYLFHTNRTPDDAPFVNEFEEVRYNHFTYVPAITRPGDIESWDGETGYIDAEMLGRYIDDITAPVYYIIGPQKFVRGMEKMLDAEGVPELHIKSEIFSGYAERQSPHR